MTENRETENITGKNDNNSSDAEYIIDFTTSSAISRVNIKFLALYIPIMWLSGLAICVYMYEYFIRLNFVINF